MRRALVVLAVALAAGLSAGATTAAATQAGLTFTEGTDRYDPGGSSGTVTGGPGDDAVRVSFVAGGFEVEDLRTTVTATGECTALDEHHARCVARHPGGTPSLTVDVGDGDDHVALASGGDGTVVRGGAGDDTLEAAGRGRADLDGGPGDDVLRGGEGDDVLTGGPGRDDLDGGAGSDGLHAGAIPEAGERYVAGAGPGVDALFVVSSSAAPVTVDLAAQALAVGGAAGGMAVAEGFARAEATGAAVTLLGDDRPNVLRAGDEGGAVLDGRGGADELRAGGRSTLRGGTGRDLLELAPGADADGGPGDDRLVGVEGGQLADDGRQGTRLACGDGAGDVLAAVGAVVAPADCETYVVDLGWELRRRQARGRTVRFALRGTGPCGAVVALRDARGRRVSDRARLPEHATATAWHRIALTLRRGVRRPATIRVALTALGRCADEGDLDAPVPPGTRVAAFSAGS